MIRPPIWNTRRLVRAWHRRWGWPGTLVVISAGAMLAAWWWIGVQHERARDAMLAPVRLDATMTEPKRVAPVDVDRARLRAFDQTLAAPGDATGLLEDVLVAAEKQGLAIDRGDYRVVADDAGGFVRFRMTLPVSGNIGALRRFMNEALRDHPALALESLRVGREKIESAQVDARIQWSLMMRPDADAAGDAIARTRSDGAMTAAMAPGEARSAETSR